MSKQEAINAMTVGHLVTHGCFAEGEFIYMKDGKIYDEDDLCMDHGVFDFWTDRSGEIWQTGWKIYE